jgi:polar amino acid transport system substrate-binding protein
MALVGAIALSACGSDEETASSTASTAAAAAESTAAADTTADTAAAPAGDGTTASGGVDCQPVEAGVLTVVTSLPGPNFWGTDEVDPDDISSGIEYDLATDLAEKCGLEMEFRNESFDAIVAGQVAADSYDIILSQVTITEDRAKVVDFSTGYFKSDQGLLVPTGTEVTSWDDVKAMTIGVQASTTAEYYVTSGEVPGWELTDVKAFPDLASAYAALNAGQVDGVMIDTPINLGQASQSGGKLEVVAQFTTGEEYGAIFGKDTGKKEIFDPIIQSLVDDGTVNELIAKYLGGDPSTVPVIEVPAA